MSRMSEVREQYSRLEANAPEIMRAYYQGILLGLDLGQGAMAVDILESQGRVQVSDVPTWRKAPTPTIGTRSKDMTQPCTVYALCDPREDEDEPLPFFVGSSVDPEAQLADYIKATEVKVSAKPKIDEIVAAGSRPVILVLKTGIPLSDANAVKGEWIKRYTDQGIALVNQRG